MTHEKRKFTKVIDLIRLLITIDQNGAMTAAQIAQGLDMSHITVTRLMRRLRDEYQVVIERPPGSRGTYKIKDWGLIDRAKAYDLLMRDAVIVRTRPRLI